MPDQRESVSFRGRHQARTLMKMTEVKILDCCKGGKRSEMTWTLWIQQLKKADCIGGIRHITSRIKGFTLRLWIKTKWNHYLHRLINQTVFDDYPLLSFWISFPMFQLKYKWTTALPFLILFEFDQINFSKTTVFFLFIAINFVACSVINLYAYLYIKV